MKHENLVLSNKLIRSKSSAVVIRPGSLTCLIKPDFKVYAALAT